MLNQLMAYHLDDDAPICPDPSHDDLWSAQAKRYHRLGSESDGSNAAKFVATIHGHIKLVK